MATNTKPRFVVDNSVIMASLLQEPISTTKIVDSLSLYYSHKAIFYAPIILPFEAGNVLHSCFLSHRITLDKARELYKYFLRLPIKYIVVSNNQIFKTCVATNLTYYDASYLSLSQKLHIPLLTLDKKLTSLHP